MRNLLFTLLAAVLIVITVQAKKALSHDDFDNWKSVRVESLTQDGKWAAYIVCPQEGDSLLTFRNTANGKQIDIERGYKPSFTADGKYAVALIKPFFKEKREARIAKKKKYELPQDSMVIVNLSTGNLEKVPNITGYQLGNEGGTWLAYSTCDTTYISAKDLKDKVGSKPLLVRDLAVKDFKPVVINNVKDYNMSKYGNALSLNIKKLSKDTVAQDGVALMLFPDTTLVWLDKDQYWFSTPVFNEEATMVAYSMSNDSIDSGTKKATLRMANIAGHKTEAKDMWLPKAVNDGKYPNLRQPRITDPTKRDSIMQAMHDRVAEMAGDSIYLNQYSPIAFSYDGRRLITGVAPYIAPDDTTIVDFERAKLDIWRWDAPMTPPQENHNVSKLLKKTYPVVIDLETGTTELLYSDPLCSVNAPNRWDGDWALLHDPSANYVERQWNYMTPEELYVVNVITGEKRKVADVPQDMSELSPAGKYVTWFNNRNYYVYDIASGETRCLTQDFEFPLWDEDQDTPMQRLPYGDAGWLDDDAGYLVYDRHDIWLLDPKGINKPVNLTNGEGRKTNRRYKYVKTDPEKRSFSQGDEILLALFDYTDKRHGFATTKIGKPATPVTRTLEENTFTQLRRAKNAPVYAFQKSNFSTSPNVYIARNNDFAKAVKVTDANPQMAEYNWGTAELVKWYAYNGDLTEGVLYKPEDFDPNKKYPMLAVFYETNSEELYRHYTMEPSWSWVNYPFYVSRGYVVFVPDIHYFPGIPGEGAYNYVCSGVEDLCNKYEWIDRDRIGIDGQSWGGYQTAYLITRTNMFACAGSGAPVANMTSAFGGIRWESGDSRQAQYEMGQSRIGRNLWDATELYLANSPVFYADRVNTPLLIMHNDADGAVPWYQGIEYFMALRRLGKPVWMLQYNGEAHNIRARKNRKDITIRLQQFFDHYLKGDPMPRWMKEGIPAVRKGQEMRTELINNE